MTEYVLACTRTFRTITPVCSYSPCPSAPRRAAVTLPRLSTRRQPEELKPRTWHLVCSTTAAKELLSKCTRSDVKYTRTFTSLVFAKPREGVSFAWLKGLVHRFFFFSFFFTYATPSPLLPNSIIRQYYRAFPPDGLFSYLVKVSRSHSGVRTPAARRSCLPCWLFFWTLLSRCFGESPDRRELASSPCYSEQSAVADQQTVSIEPGALRWIAPHLKQANHRGGAVYPDPSGGLKISPRHWKKKKTKKKEKRKMHSLMVCMRPAPLSSVAIQLLNGRWYAGCVQRHQLRDFPSCLTTLPVPVHFMESFLPSFRDIRTHQEQMNWSYL